MSEASVDYVTEEQASALRAASDGFAKWWSDFCSMEVVIGHVRVPQREAVRFMADWRKSGAWALRGSKPSVMGRE